MDTLVPPRPPSINGTSLDRSPRNITNSFGDGYVQDTPDGINPIVGQLTLTWAQLLPSEADALDQFFAAHQAAPFFYQLPSTSGAARKWIPGKWTRTYLSPTYHSMSVTLTERFNSTNS